MATRLPSFDLQPGQTPATRTRFRYEGKPCMKVHASEFKGKYYIAMWRGRKAYMYLVQTDWITVDDSYSIVDGKTVTPNALTFDLKKLRKLFIEWHRSEITTPEDERDYADRLIQRMKEECLAKETGN